MVKARTLLHICNWHIDRLRKIKNENIPPSFFLGNEVKDAPLVA